VLADLTAVQAFPGTTPDDMKLAALEKQRTLPFCLAKLSQVRPTCSSPIQRYCIFSIRKLTISDIMQRTLRDRPDIQVFCFTTHIFPFRSLSFPSLPLYRPWLHSFDNNVPFIIYLSPGGCVAHDVWGCFAHPMLLLVATPLPPLLTPCLSNT
jgi:hypothetical protein